MKSKIYALLLSLLILSCSADKKEKTYLPRAVSENEDFNIYPTAKDAEFSIVKYAGSGKKEEDESFGIKFRDTLIRIQTDQSDPKFVADTFSVAEFINTQKTTLLVQLADKSGQVAPFYIISLKKDQPEIVSLYRASKGENDIKYTKGMIRVGNSGYLINNDYFVTRVNAKVYSIPRQKPEERIQGDFFLNSPDRNTLVFLVPQAFYQVNYPTGDVFTQPFAKDASKGQTNMYKWVQDNFAWVKNGKGVSFFKAIDTDKLIDMRRKF